MTKKSKQRKQKGKKASPTPNQPARILTRIPEAPNQIVRIRRALTRQFSWYPTGGLDATGLSTMQVTFSPGATDWRLGGVSVYTDALPNSAEFSNLFDQYKVSNVMVRCDYTINNLTNSGPTSAGVPLMFHTLDYDDPGDLTLNGMLEYPQSRVHSFQTGGYQPLMLSFKPRPLMDVAGSGVSTGYSPTQVVPFLRTAEMTIPHYGLKFAINVNGASGGTIIGYFRFVIWYDLEFTNPK